MGRAAGPGRPLVGPDPAADRARRLAGARRLARRDRGGRRPIGPRRAGAAVVPRHRRTARAALKNAYADDPKRRLALVDDLIKVIPAGAAGIRHDPALRAPAGPRAAAAPADRRAGARRPPRSARDSQGLKRPLYPYQREGVRRFLGEGRLLLADDMGLGKTAQAIAACGILWRSGRVRRGLIIAPASLKPQWAREWAVFSDLPIEIVDGSPDDRQALYASRKEGFLIINYEQLLRDLEIVRALEPRPGRARRGAADQELGDQDGALGQGADAAPTAWC